MARQQFPDSLRDLSKNVSIGTHLITRTLSEPIIFLLRKGFLRLILVSSLKQGRILSDSDEFILCLFSPKQMLKYLVVNWY